jgi:hypothetical protein
LSWTFARYRVQGCPGVRSTALPGPGSARRREILLGRFQGGKRDSK